MVQESLPIEGEPPEVPAPDDVAEENSSTKKHRKRASKASSSQKSLRERAMSAAERAARKAAREVIAEHGKRSSKKSGKKSSKKANKKTSKKTSKKASKKAGKTAKRKTSKRAADGAGKAANEEFRCEAVAHVIPVRSLGEAEPVQVWDGSKWVNVSPPERSPRSDSAREHSKLKVAAGVAASVAAAAAVAGGVYLLRRKSGGSGSGPANEDLGPSQGSPLGMVQLPPPIRMGNIPEAYTRIYQLFDRFVEGGKEFFANLGDSESGHNLNALNPAGAALSKAGVERQMQSPDYGKPWSGHGPVPYTAYLEPEKAKALPAMGLFQGIAGTIGQAGRRNGKAILAPLPVAMWIEPRLQLAAFMELFGALYHNYGAKTPEQMRIAWGYPSKATKPTDPYYVDRAAKWAERQKKTGVSSTSFGKMTLWDYTVDEVVAYFSQFDYSPVVQTGPILLANLAQPSPVSRAVQARLEDQLSTPAFIGNDWRD